ncbi:MAG: hypothetical protein ABH851_02405 [Methanobacteriota archaeon]
MNLKKTSKTIIPLIPLSMNVSAITGKGVVEPFYRLVCGFFLQFYIQLSLAALMWAYAGAKWILSRDDDQQRLLAKDLLTYVMLGLTLLLIAEGIVYLIFQWDFRATFCS